MIAFLSNQRRVITQGFIDWLFRVISFTSILYCSVSMCAACDSIVSFLTYNVSVNNTYGFT